MSCHSKIETADQTSCLPQSQSLDSGPSRLRKTKLKGRTPSLLLLPPPPPPPLSPPSHTWTWKFSAKKLWERMYSTRKMHLEEDVFNKENACWKGCIQQGWRLQGKIHLIYFFVDHELSLLTISKICWLLFDSNEHLILSGWSSLVNPLALFFSEEGVGGEEEGRERD